MVAVLATLGGTLAQDATRTAATEGRLGAPAVVEVGDVFDAVGFEVVPSDLEVKMEYSEHFVLDGESCDSASAGASAGALAPIWVTLEACSTGKGQVRLVASNTGAVIEEVSVTVREAHPLITDTVMNYIGEPDCSPHPFDIMAIHALYQPLNP